MESLPTQHILPFSNFRIWNKKNATSFVFRNNIPNDAASLIEKFKIDWGIIIKESVHQTEIGGDVFSAFLFDFLYELKEDFKVDVPKEVIKKTMKITEKIIEEKLKSSSIVKVTDFRDQ